MGAQLAQAAFKKGHALKQVLRDKMMFGFIEGIPEGGVDRTITSPIEGLPDVEESHCVSAQFQDPEYGPHMSKLLEGITQVAVTVTAADMDEQARMKGFGGEPAK